jgi:hypothetical protein
LGGLATFVDEGARVATRGAVPDVAAELVIALGVVLALNVLGAEIGVIVPYGGP